METSAARLDRLLYELRRRAFRVAGKGEPPEDEASLVRPQDVERVEQLIAENRWEHLRVRD